MSNLIIDVREPDEYDGSHVEGAINIPLSKLAQNISSIDKNDEIIVYCASGARASVAQKILIGFGYESVKNGINQKNTERML